MELVKDTVIPFHVMRWYNQDLRKWSERENCSAQSCAAASDLPPNTKIAAVEVYSVHRFGLNRAQ